MAVSEISQLPWTPIIDKGGFVYSEYWEEILPEVGNYFRGFISKSFDGEGES